MTSREKCTFWSLAPIFCQLRLCLAMLLWVSRFAAAQPGFVSIDCGGDQDFTSGEGIEWRVDDFSNFNHSRGLVGVEQDLGSGTSTNASLARELRTLRYFPSSVSPRRSCYDIPLSAPDATYLLRAGFRYGNYDGLNRPPSFLVTLNYDYWAYVQLKSANHTIYLETITSQQVGVDLTFCLIRVDDSRPALVNSVELRLIPPGRYIDDFAAPFVHTYLNLVTRVNFGGPFVRYPQDVYDRFWQDGLTVFPELKNYTVLQTNLPVDVRYDASGTISGAVDRGDPPLVVMQTALTNDKEVAFSLNPVTQLLLGSDVYKSSSPIQIFPTLYLAYFNKTPEEYVAFDFACTDLFIEYGADLPVLPPPLTTTQYTNSAAVNATFNQTTCRIYKNTSNMIDPQISGAEFFTGQEKIVTGTSFTDVEAWTRIIQSFNLQNLGFGDPCLPTPWDELDCSTDTATSLIRITHLDLSRKNLTGPIPTNIASLTSLNYLNLSNNKLNGNFPSWLEGLSNLKFLDVSNNKLTGRYPQDLVTNLGSNFSYSGNPGLCSTECSENITSRIIVGAVVGGFCLLAIILGPYLYLVFLSNSSTNGLFDKDYRALQARLRDKGARTQPFCLSRVKQATKNFGNKIGQGGFGPVYRGVFKDGQEVAVKVLSGTSKQGKQEFYNEIELLSVVHHKYLVSLVGYCQSWNKQILIYEFMEGGDLAKRLRGESAVKEPLTWNDRCAIISEVAEGLDYLHNGCSPAVIHRDVKSNNILLDSKLSAKVADFGLSKLLQFDHNSATHITTTVKGTTGYLDPEYYISGKLNEKSDVYGFGILLMEILTGRAPVDPSAAPSHLFILDWVLQVRNSETLEQLVDKNIKNEYDPKTFSELVHLSLWCVEQNSRSRPTMTEVVHELRVMGLETASTAHKCRRADVEHLLVDEDEDEVQDLPVATSLDNVSGPTTSNVSSPLSR